MTLALVALAAALPVSAEPPQQSRCQLCNEGVDYAASWVARPNHEGAAHTGAWLVTMRITDGGPLSEWAVVDWHAYWVDDHLTCEKLELMEFDFLIRTSLLDLIVPLWVLQSMSEQEILVYGERLRQGWHFLRDMTFPDEVRNPLDKLLESTESARAYLDGPTPLASPTAVFRILSEVGAGGTQAVGYLSHESGMLRLEAVLELAALLEGSGIFPW